MAYGPIGNTNGLTYFSLITQSSGISLTQITNTPTQLCFFSMGNINAAARYLKVIDAPGTVQSSAGFTASMSFIIPGNTAGAGSNGHIAAYCISQACRGDILRRKGPGGRSKFIGCHCRAEKYIVA